MDWLGIIAPTLIAIAVVLVPGLVSTIAVRIHGIERIAAAALAGMVCLGVAGVVGHAVGLAFAAWQSLVVAVVVAVILLVLRRAFRGDWLPRFDTPQWGTVLAVGASWLASSVLLAVIAFADVSSPSRFSQTYDNVFHLSAIARILETGDASSMTLRTMIETDKAIAVYPSGWHSLVAATVQLTGADVPTAANAVWIAVAAVLWLPGAAWLSRVVLRGTQPATVAVVSFPLAASFGAFPVALLAWGTLYPTFIATAALPGAIAAIIVAARAAIAPVPHRVWRRGLAAGAVVVAVGAIAVGQPRVIATLTVLLAPLVAWRVATVARREWREGGPHRRRVKAIGTVVLIVVVLIIAAGFWYLVAKLGLFARPLDERLGGPQAKAVQAIGVGLLQVIGQSWLVGDGGRATWPALLVAGAIGAGIIACWRRPRVRWLVVSYVIVAVLFALAAGSDDVVTKLATGLWYKDRYRLSSALPVAGVVLATAGVIAATRFLESRTCGRCRGRASLALANTSRLPALSAWVIALSAAVSLIFGGMSQAVGRVFALPEGHATTQIASRAQLEFMRSIRDTVPLGQRVLADPWGGSTLVWLEAHREPVFPHVNGQWDADRQVLATRLQDIRTDPAVCRALDHLRVRYVLFNPHELAGGDPAGNLFPGPNAAVAAGLFTPVASDGETSLYRIDECGPLDL